MNTEEGKYTYQVMEVRMIPEIRQYASTWLAGRKCKSASEYNRLSLPTHEDFRKEPLSDVDDSSWCIRPPTETEIELMKFRRITKVDRNHQIQGKVWYRY